MQKKCTKCLEWKNQSEFFKDKQKKSGYRPDCKVCNIKRSVAYNKKNRERKKITDIKWSTGVSEKDYLELLRISNSKCSICSKSEKENGRRLSIDHCHTSQLVRGLLCHSCNVGLGYFNDNQEILKKAIKYLKNNYSDRGIIHKEKKHKIIRND